MKPALFALPILAFALAATAHADVLYLQGLSASGNGYDITSYRLADDFVPAADATVSSISFWYAAQYQTDLSAVTYAIYADQAGALGTLLQSETAVPALSVDAGSGQYLAQFGITPLALAGGTPYWLELHAGASLTDDTGYAISWLAADDNRRRGEFVVAVSGPPPRQGLDAEAERVLQALLAELPVKQAAKLAAKITGAGKNALYDRALEMKDL